MGFAAVESNCRSLPSKRPWPGHRHGGVVQTQGSESVIPRLVHREDPVKGAQYMGEEQP